MSADKPDQRKLQSGSKLFKLKEIYFMQETFQNNSLKEFKLAGFSFEAFWGI